ncbi:uncharacterized protein I303_104449 [Kwoniella dejecticola CBS 10117]|uniref:FAD/NAD(P)-binding domain-containing protein n=1 Tax=Kwoniella dejecticola CBS 10117 TaxID=1296121 RepID=A0A1A6A599_9TREE|nr:uncharacterized protein I303_04572 [Kwoniella dejecticola CBS 10117]OBR85239.1 hypothetical protein I303_04572 [Kwoniella dejecticola CBS 10117]
MSEHRPRIAIIGAGPGGISLALSLKQKGVHDFVVYERESGIGGVWYQNRYPGYRCDIDALYYSHSRYPYNFGESHPPRKVVQEYWDSICFKEDLHSQFHSNTTLKSASWDPSDSTYKLILENRDGTEVKVNHQYLISAIGSFSSPSRANIPGLQDFEGEIIRSWSWPEELGLAELRGKRVAVLGNGCTGTQLITVLSRDPEIEVIAISRSVRWLKPGTTKEGPHTVKWSKVQSFLYSIAPFRWVARLGVFLTMETYWIGFAKKSILTPIVRKAQNRVARWMSTSAPEKLREKIVPDYPVGSNRITFDGGYLNALNQPNVTAVLDAVQQVKGSSLILQSGQEFQADCIVLATGFDTAASLNVQGREGHLMAGKRDHLEYYHGIAIPGFHNVFSLQGNNSTAGHFSSLFQIEVQAEYIASLLAKTGQQDAKVIEVKESSTKEYNEWIDRRLDKTVWSGKESWYRADGGKGRIFTHWPGPATLYWWINRKINWDDWVITGANP